MQQGRGIRDILLEKVDPHEPAHGITVINGVLHPFVGQVEPALQQIHPQCGFDLNGRTSSFPAGVVRHNQRHPFLPWNDLVHDLQKFFPFCFFFRQLYSMSLILSCFIPRAPLFLILSHLLSFRGILGTFVSRETVCGALPPRRAPQTALLSQDTQAPQPTGRYLDVAAIMSSAKRPSSPSSPHLAAVFGSLRRA